MSAQNWRQSSINITIGMFFRDLIMPGFLVGYDVDTTSILVSCASGPVEYLTSITSK